MMDVYIKLLLLVHLRNEFSITKKLIGNKMERKNIYIILLICSIIVLSCRDKTAQDNSMVDIDVIQYVTPYNNVSLLFNIHYPINDNIVSDSIKYYIKKELLKNNEIYKNEFFQSYIDTTLYNRKRFCLRASKEEETNKYIVYSFSKGFDFDFVFEENIYTFRKRDGKRMTLNNIIKSPSGKDFIKLLRFYIIKYSNGLQLDTSNAAIIISLKKSSIFFSERFLNICYCLSKQFVYGSQIQYKYIYIKIPYDVAMPFMTKDALELIE